MSSRSRRLASATRSALERPTRMRSPDWRTSGEALSDQTMVEPAASAISRTVVLAPVRA